MTQSLERERGRTDGADHLPPFMGRTGGHSWPPIQQSAVVAAVARAAQCFSFTGKWDGIMIFCDRFIMLHGGQDDDDGVVTVPWPGSLLF